MAAPHESTNTTIAWMSASHISENPARQEIWPFLDIVQSDVGGIGDGEPVSTEGECVISIRDAPSRWEHPGAVHVCAVGSSYHSGESDHLDDFWDGGFVNQGPYCRGEVEKPNPSDLVPH